MSKPHALYRFFDSDGVLLYVGITMDPGSRWRTHRDDKPWWSEVAHIAVETHPDRLSVLEAERLAIQAEAPRYNVVHNRRKAIATAAAPARPRPGSPDLCDPRLDVDHSKPYDSSINEWEFSNRRSGYTRISDLYLYWEVNGTAMSGDYLPDEIDATQLFRRWRRKYAATRYASIYWSLLPVQETAPFQHPAPWADGRDFLRYFTWPYNVHTGELLNFNRLPVLDGRWTTDAHDKGGFFQEATGWKPAPMQTTVDLTQVCSAALLNDVFATPISEEHFV